MMNSPDAGNASLERLQKELPQVLEDHCRIRPSPRRSPSRMTARQQVSGP